MIIHMIICIQRKGGLGADVYLLRLISIFYLYILINHYFEPFNGISNSSTNIFINYKFNSVLPFYNYCSIVKLKHEVYYLVGFNILTVAHQSSQ